MNITSLLNWLNNHKRMVIAALSLCNSVKLPDGWRIEKSGILPGMVKITSQDKVTFPATHESGEFEIGWI